MNARRNPLQTASPAPSPATSGSIARRFRFLGLGMESGQASIEMAFVMPLCLAIVFGMVQSSLLLQTYCNATFACRNAARYASLNSTSSLSPASPTQVAAVAKLGLFMSSSISPTINVNYFNAGNLSSSSSNLCTPPVGGANTTLDVVGNVVCVQVTWSQRLSIPFMPTNSITITTQSYRIISR